MIHLEREEPRILVKLEALKCRLEQSHFKLEVINRYYSSFKSGYQGEKSLDYYFSLMDEDKYDFYHGLRLFNGKSYFQIDTLIISNTFIAIIEIKYLSGTIDYDKRNNRFTRKDVILKNPFSQVKLQKLQFVEWLQKQKSPPVPVDFLIAMSNPTTKINTPSGVPDQFWKLCNGPELIEKIQIYEEMYKIEHLSSKDRRRLKKLLLKYHTPLDVDILKKYKFPKEDIIPGVRCPLCNAIPMEHTYGSWRCPNCHHKSKDAHVKTVHDHFLIMGPTITNKQFREFTRLPSRQLASRLLAEMNLPYTGTNKGRIYYSPDHNPTDNKKE